MADAKACPKCNGTMTQGRILKHNEYTAGSKYIYIFAPDDEGGPDLSKMFSGKPMSKARKPLAAFSCEGCGYTELYSLPTT